MNTIPKDWNIDTFLGPKIDKANYGKCKYCNIPVYRSVQKLSSHKTGRTCKNEEHRKFFSNIKTKSIEVTSRTPITLNSNLGSTRYFTPSEIATSSNDYFDSNDNDRNIGADMSLKRAKCK